MVESVWTSPHQDPSNPPEELELFARPSARPCQIQTGTVFEQEKDVPGEAGKGFCKLL